MGDGVEASLQPQGAGARVPRGCGNSWPRAPACPPQTGWAEGGGGPGRGFGRTGLGSADHEASGACEIEKLMQPAVGQRSKAAGLGRE